MPIKLSDLSRAVSHALRHEPWLYELELDGEGWVGTDQLVAALRAERPDWRDLSGDLLSEMVRTASKQRHEIAGDRIRALYGHSLPDRLVKSPAQPPELLFHGTAPQIVADIRAQGLRPMGRQYVHLSTDREMAGAVGRRKSATPVILVVRAGEAAAAGIQFYTGNDRVWLADHVPAAHIAGKP
ncbi:RNA 2'-phosphotransferase [Reyranella sp.]|uniref:RNA 2'-phosphotransferase n=1 Tax=Reyranella sp. TaxID=1929291 RepID=UPI003BABD663